MQPESTPRNAQGLTPQQEQAAESITAGLSVQEVADRLGVHRTTLWHWRNLETFQAYLNALRADAQSHRVLAIGALQEKAIQTVQQLLESKSEGVALRAAALVPSSAKASEPGTTDPRKLIRARMAAASEQLLFDSFSSPFDSDATNDDARSLASSRKAQTEGAEQYFHCTRSSPPPPQPSCPRPHSRALSP